MTGLYSFFTRKQKPLPKVSMIDIIDIRKTAQEFLPIEPFVFLHRMITIIMFSDTTADPENFAEAGALTDGIKYLYNEKSLLRSGGKDFTIKKNVDFCLLAFDHNPLSETPGAITRVLTTRLTFEKFSPEGLDLRTPNVFKIITQDDLSGIGIEIKIALEGWIWGKVFIKNK